MFESCYKIILPCAKIYMKMFEIPQGLVEETETESSDSTRGKEKELELHHVISLRNNLHIVAHYVQIVP